MRPVVVVTGLTAGLAVVRALGRRGVPVVFVRCQWYDMAHASRYVRAVYDSPAPEADEEGFLGVLDRVARDWPDAVLMPVDDEATVVVAGNRARLERAGFAVAAPDEKLVGTFVDKAATHALATAAGVPAPVTLAPASVDELEAYRALGGFPAVVKPLVSHRYTQVFRRKWVRVDDLDAAVRAFRTATEAGFEVLIQELIPGDEACGAVYSSYSVGGRQVVEFTAEKVRNSPAESGSPSVTVSRQIPGAAANGRRLLNAAGYDGFACAEFKLDPRDGEYKLMEVNVRHNLSGLLATHCGVEFPHLEYRHVADGVLPVQPAYPEGVYWVDISRDARVAASYLRRADCSAGSFLRPYLSGHVFAVLAASDPRPAGVRAAHDVRKVGTRFLSSLGARSREPRWPPG